MQFISAGAIKQEELRKLAVQHLFLFDTSVDRETVKTPIGLKNAAPECRSCTHTLTGDVMAATPISGVKNNKMYLAHTGNIYHFTVRSNNEWFFIYGSSGASDTYTPQDHADRYVTVSDSPQKRDFMNIDANMIGTYTGYSNNNIALTTRSYFLPQSRLALFSNKDIMWMPTYPENVFGGTTGEFTYTYSVAGGLFAAQADYFYQLSGYAYPTGQSYNGQQAVKLITAPNRSGFLMMGPAYTYVRRYFANATWYTSYGGGTSWNAGNGNANGKTNELPYIGVNQADDPDASLSFGAIAIEGQLGREMLIVDVGQDMELTTGSAVGTEPQFKVNAAMLAQFSMTRLIEV